MVYRYLQRAAHESPVIFYSLVIGAVVLRANPQGPIMVMTVPPIRKSMGWKPAERVPTTFPLPNRARQPVSGYADP